MSPELVVERCEKTDFFSRELEFGNPLRWYVVHTKPGNEERVRGNLQNQEIESYLPLVRTGQYRNGKIIERVKPLFPNYLFARMDLALHYYRVKWTRGVNRILGSGEGPQPISDSVVRTIREREGKEGLIELIDEFKEGDLVQVTAGPLKDLIGVFKKDMSSRGRVKILLSLIGVEIPVQISRYQIRRLA